MSSPRIGHARMAARLAGLWAAAVVAGFSIAMMAAARVERIDPALARAGSFTAAAGPALLALAGGILLGQVLYILASTVGIVGERVSRHFAPNRPAPTDETTTSTRFDVALALLVLAGAWAAFKWLAIPLRVAGRGEVGVPMVGAAAGPLLLPLSIGLTLEALLGLLRLTLGESARWWIARALLRMAWIAGATLVITGPNLLRGDSLEWASRIGPTPLSAAWLESAPRAVASVWPMIQVGLAGMLLLQLLSLVREAPGMWRRRTGTRVVATPAD